jgi:AraC-like DNA-binding protein
MRTISSPLAVGDVGRGAGQVVRLHVLGVVDHGALQAVARVVQVARELGLAVHHHRAAAAVLVQVHAVHAAVVGDEEALVDLALAVHALAALRLAHQLGEAVLQHAGADAAEHVLAALPLEHDGVDALQVQQLRQHQPRGPAADDAHGFHGLHGLSPGPTPCATSCSRATPTCRRLLGSAWVGQADGAADAVMEQLAQEYAGRSTARALLLRGLAATLLGHAARVAERLAERGAPVRTRMAESHLLQRFEALLEAHFRDHWTVADYAQALAVTPTHLSRVVRSALGVPASRLIDARVVREARRHLAYTHLAVATIGYALGFSDPGRNRANTAAAQIEAKRPPKPCGQSTCQAKNSARLRITPTTAAVMPVSGAVNRACRAWPPPAARRPG